jgi:tripartite-type tricarboxylate transporter receptor subunit TctC
MKTPKLHEMLLPWTRRTVLLAALVGTHAAWSQPTAGSELPIRVVVTTPAGGPVDVVARLLSEGASRRLKQPVIVENRAGASGGIGMSHVAQQPPDGRTLLLGPTAAFTLVPVVRKMPYKPLDDFSFLGQLVFSPNVFAVPASSTAKTMREFVDLVRTKPGKLNYGTMLGIPQHLDFERLKRDLSLDIQSVPYPGGAPIVQALISDQVQATLASASLVTEWARNGKVRILATPGAQRLALLPEVPTLAEAGFAQIKLDAGQYYCLAAPANMAQPLADRLYQAFAAAASDPDTLRKLQGAGFELSPREGPALRAELARELADTEKLVRMLNIRLD